jgi:hypothetical protein
VSVVVGVCVRVERLQQAQTEKGEETRASSRGRGDGDAVSRHQAPATQHDESRDGRRMGRRSRCAAGGDEASAPELTLPTWAAQTGRRQARRRSAAAAVVDGEGEVREESER